MSNKKIALAITLSLALISCGEGSDTTTTSAESTSNVAAIPVMQAGRSTGLEFTVTKVATPAGIEFGPQANKGEVFVIVGYKLKNTSDRPLSMMDRPALTLIDSAGQSYNPDDFLTASAGVEVADQSSFIADINPNLTIQGRAGWKLDAASFDKAKWRLGVASDPRLTFALQ